MAAKELVLLPKDKYDSLKSDRHMEVNSISTQTESDLKTAVSEDTTKSQDRDSNVYTKSDSMFIRASNDKLPGISFMKSKRMKKRVIKWMPY